MLWSILGFAAATAALAALGCLLWARLLLPLRMEDMIALLPGSGDGARLEQNVRACLLLKRWGILRQNVWIIDQGLTEEGRRVAARLTGLDSTIRLYPAAATQHVKPFD